MISVQKTDIFGQYEEGSAFRMQCSKPGENIFYIDRLITIHGDTVLSKCELNPIALQEAGVKCYVGEHKVLGFFSLKTMQEMTENAEVNY